MAVRKLAPNPVGSTHRCERSPTRNEPRGFVERKFSLTGFLLCGGQRDHVRDEPGDFFLGFGGVPLKKSR